MKKRKPRNKDDDFYDDFFSSKISMTIPLRSDDDADADADMGKRGENTHDHPESRLKPPNI